MSNCSTTPSAGSCGRKREKMRRRTVIAIVLMLLPASVNEATLGEVTLGCRGYRETNRPRPEGRPVFRQLGVPSGQLDAQGLEADSGRTRQAGPRETLPLAPSARSNPTAFQAVSFQHGSETMEDGGVPHSAHAVYDIKYHVIWITKYRYKMLRGSVAERARDLIRQICEAQGSGDHPGSGVAGSYPHAGVGAAAVGAVEDWCNTSRAARRGGCRRSFELRKRYWGQHLWARGYFCATVGAVDEETIRSTSRASNGTKTGGVQDHSAHQALSRLCSRRSFRRLQPQADFQSSINLPALVLLC